VVGLVAGHFHSTVSEPQTPDERSDVVISVQNLTKQFGRFAALRGVTASFQRARLYGILGDNGAGKTTLLRTLAGLVEPTRGTVSILGKTNPRETCRDFGYIARLYGMSDSERCAQIITAVGLDPQLQRPVGQYSQGMRQRISLARALLHDPQILLLDEPFSNVDIRSAREMVKLLAGMRDQGKSIFVVTHQASLLKGAADEFVWMQNGLIVNRTRDLSFMETA